MDKINEFGQEVLSDRPISLPVQLAPRRSTLDDLRRQYRLAAQIAAMDGMETPEEADDFDVGDDYDPNTSFEDAADHYNIDLLNSDVQNFLASQTKQESTQPPVRSDDRGIQEETPSPDLG